MKYPYLVYRLIPSFYSKTEINFVKEKNLLSTGRGITVHWEKDIYDESGKITGECRIALQAIAKEQSKKSTRSVCLVYSQDDCDYIEPDGTLLTSTQPPYSKMRFSDGEYETEIISNSGKIDEFNFIPIENSDEVEAEKKKGKVEESKIKKLLSVVILFSLLCLTDCTVVHNAKGEKTKNNLPTSKSNSANAENTLDGQNKKYPRKKSFKPTARCRDGWISYSNSRRGTCSKHFRVAEWLR